MTFFKKFIIVLLVVSILSTQIVNSLIEANFLYENEEGDSLSNVIIVGFVCLDSNCAVVDPLWNTNTWIETPYEQPLNTLNQNPSIQNGITLYFPNSHLYESDYGYMWRYFVEGYRSKVQPPWAIPDGDYIIQPNPIIRVFEKTDNCKSEFTPTIQSCAEAGLPLSILTDTQLSAETKSAYIPSNDYYYPKDDPFFRKWRELKTKMHVDVTPYGSSSSVPGFPTSDTYDIYADQTHDFSFLWQTSKDTDPGTYTVTMESSVPDAKCDQSNDIPVTKSFDVYIAPTLDGCKAELNSFAVNPPNPDINQEITFTGTHLNTFQNWSYTSPTVIKFPAL